MAHTVTHPARQPQASTVDGRATDRSTWPALVLIAILTCLAYWPALHGGFLWDDDGHVTKPELQSTTGLYRIWFDIHATQQYYPLLHSAFWLEHRLWGDQPVYYHVLNLLLHLGAACFVYLNLHRLQVPGAVLAAAIFALHPVHVESVAWICEQKNTLSAVFYLAALLAYLHFDESRRATWYASALGLFLLALASKTVTASLPAALLVIFWWKRGQLSFRRDVLPLLPWFVIGIGAGLLSAWVERRLIGAEGTEYDLTSIERCLLAGRVVWFYVGKLFWPTHLTFVYPRWEINAKDPVQWLYPVAVLGVLAFLWAIRRWSRGPLAGALFFVGTLFPVLGFLNVFPFQYSYVADHFQYLASLGLIVPAAAGISLALPRWLPANRTGQWAACGLLLLGLAVLTRNQSHLFAHDDIHLFETTIQQNPSAWMAYNNLGMAYAREGQTQRAIESYQEGLQVRPNFDKVQNNLGNAYRSLGQTDAALKHYQLALELNPNYSLAHYNLGLMLLDLGQTQTAYDHLSHALELTPDFSEGHNTISKALMRMQRPTEAIAHLRQALDLQPNHALAHYNLGAALLELNQPQEAVKSFGRYLELEPSDAQAWQALAVALVRCQRGAEAVAALQKALVLARAQGNAALAAQLESQLAQLTRPR